MTEPTLRCQGCGALLPTPEAVCGRCEAELSAEAHSPPGKYICPHCHERIAGLVQVPWPPHVAWWRPTTMRLQCPRCDTPLRDRHAVQLPGWLMAVVIVAALGVQLFTTGWLRPVLGFTLLGVVYAPLLAAALKIRKDFDNPHRFVEGSSRFWAQGNDQLQRAVEGLRRGDPSH